MVKHCCVALITLVLAGCTSSRPVSVGKGGELELGTKERVREYINTQDLNKRLTGKNTFAEIASVDPNLITSGDPKMREEYASMLVGCQKVLSGFEASASGWGTFKLAIATVGSIAGSVGVPALTAAAAVANKTAIAALGGLSGVTNALQGSLTEQGLTSVNILAEREAIRSQLLQALKKYRDALDQPIDKRPDIQANAIDEARAACTIYALNTGQQINGTAKQ